MDFDFSDIRPYEGEEITTAIAALAKAPEFSELARTLVPQRHPRAFMRRMRRISDIETFQTKVMAPAMAWIEQHFTAGVTVSGLERLDADQTYVFVSNHRDIVLDPGFMCLTLHRNKIPTPHIAIGDNLLDRPWLVHLFKLNKSVSVKRGLSQRELLKASKTLSRYVADLVRSQKGNFWIAQQEGRAKDGDDRTQTGVVKMLALAARESWHKHLGSLRLVGLSIAYEWDPCDALKARERFLRQRDGQYQKTEAEDQESMALGIFGDKGRVHLHFSEPLETDHPCLRDDCKRNELVHRVTAEMDRRIMGAYHLWPSNYLAADLLRGQTTYADHYTTGYEAEFRERLERKLKELPEGRALEPFVLEMYARPVINREISDRPEET
ncbi:1-acyl-sn-glycerol-3-phosphate acyltransferase [Sulfidibacter corallicola]|uniref:1-acyl-sn-glycerol-3-phosphate acyltransferase n=1 Tax=Sulfidibacter corallicola TaxID=2818388 RepID=A0A8A4TMS3_SULCO|nr:1-acyl-sn-glycerol-3-phosphate acyltransferase [Sulfidibacter corallicola]QTD50402.1 1-acyl-sn-glycerol-3-phosphate acyltransferase [Sulfidibacter corallicola]